MIYTYRDVSILADIQPVLVKPQAISQTALMDHLAICIMQGTHPSLEHSLDNTYAEG